MTPQEWAAVHGDCDFAEKDVKCERCGKEYVCLPWQDFYCAAEGDHCCEPCLLGGTHLAATVLVDEDDPAAPPVVWEHEVPS